MPKLKFIETVDLDMVAHMITEHMDWTPLENLGWTAITMRLMGCMKDGVPLNVVAYYDPELNKTVVRHE